jgi:hypothetical protein
MNLVQEFNMIKAAIIIGGSALTLGQAYSYYLKSNLHKESKLQAIQD